MLALVTAPGLGPTLPRSLHGAEELPLPIWEESYWICKELPALASKVLWRISVTHTTKEKLCPSVIDHDAQATQRRFWSRNLQVLIKKGESSVGNEVCWFSSVFFRLKIHTHRHIHIHTEYKTIQRTDDSIKVLDLNAENELPLAQSIQFTSSYHCIYFLLKKKKTVKWNKAQNSTRHCTHYVNRFALL